MPTFRRALLLLALAALPACDGSPTASPTGGGGATPTPTPAPAPTATARYRVTFEATWSAGSHPNEFPPNPHFSPLVGAIHRAGVRVWEPSGLATAGLEAMAELGAVTPLDQEIRALVASGAASALLLGGGISRSPGSASIELEASLAYPELTLVSMVAPSPDWFVGVSGLGLLQDGAWRDRVVVDLLAWDAGTDSGRSYRSADLDTRPRDRIRLLTQAPVAPDGMPRPLGRFLIERL